MEALLSADTSLKVEKIWLGMLRTLPPARRVAMAWDLTGSAINIGRLAVMSERPDLDAHEAALSRARFRYGAAIVHLAEERRRRLSEVEANRFPSLPEVLWPLLSALEALQITAVPLSLAIPFYGVHRSLGDISLAVERLPARQALQQRLPARFWLDETSEDGPGLRLIELQSLLPVWLWPADRGKNAPLLQRLLDSRREAPLLENAPPCAVPAPEPLLLYLLAWQGEQSATSDERWYDFLGILKMQQPSGLNLELLRTLARDLQCLPQLEEALARTGLEF
ncbi:MAG: hypothetical protein IRZ31_18020 [Thermogemmatispora sp.]|uniref:Uncharacterized protein n=1 Tax=Thermogemmatispora tikiterensis TaxID=1825093 RepID=A0A328VIG5_9CHLR|nr:MULTISPECIES: hypothetical protein [Thermogemmatispora]MBX5458793.1 hypothetical protein [Thermogemmatispora sp.]RAQ97506.1 hypothetical protein A4R35_18360 [Thermogemmatispora tikiterensis]